jgi:excinuclease ABC subunit C
MAKSAIAAIQEALKLPSCSRRFPRDIGRGRPCLNYHLGRCRAVCSGKVSKEDFGAAIAEAALLLEGKFDALLIGIKAQMVDASDKLEFERAAMLRDRYNAVSRLGRRQNVISGAFSDTDILAFLQGETRGCVVVLHFIKGSLLDKEAVFFEGTSKEDASEVLSCFIKQYYAVRMTAPGTVLLSHPVEDMTPLKEWLTQLAGRAVSLAVPKRGAKTELIRMALDNASEELRRRETREERAAKSLKLLSEMTGAETRITRIEAFDISNTSGREIVGSMVVFENAQPKKGDYRKFRIKSTHGQDDYAAMSEVISRRLDRYLNKDPKFSELPSLILVDGGRGQASAAESAANALGIRLPVYGMVKDDRHRTRALVDARGNETGISTVPAVYSLIGRIQEEAHRFAVEYHKSLRGKSGYASSLDKIPGIGQSRKKALISHFKKLANIRTATIEQLAAVLPKNVAQSVYEYYNGNNA